MSHLDLTGLTRLVAQRNTIKDRALLAQFDKTITHWLGLPASKHRRQSIAFYGVLGLFWAFALATGVIAIAATLKRIEVDAGYMKWLWGSFIGEMAPLAVWLVKEVFRKESD